MYSISRFQQIIKPVMNGRFARHVRTHQADKHSKGFGCQNLLLCLLYAQLGRRPNRCHGKILRRITVSRPGKEPLVSGCVGN